MSKKLCPHRRFVDRMPWIQINRIANALAKSGMRMPRHDEGRRKKVRRWLFRLIDIHDRNWLKEANSIVESIEAAEEVKKVAS